MTATTRGRRAVARDHAADHSAATTGPRPPATDDWQVTTSVVLLGGPADGWWYHLADWQAQWRSAARMAEVHNRGRFDPASWPMLYGRSGRIQPHRTIPNLTGEVWIWQGPSSVRSVHDLAELDAAERQEADR